MLPKKNRLPVEEIRDLKKTAKLYSGKFVGILVAENNLEELRAAIIVSTKVSKKATERNRIKRMIRAFLMENLVNKKIGYDILILAKSNIVDKNSGEINQDLSLILDKAGLL